MLDLPVYDRAAPRNCAVCGQLHPNPSFGLYLSPGGVVRYRTCPPCFASLARFDNDSAREALRLEHRHHVQQCLRDGTPPIATLGELLS